MSIPFELLIRGENGTLKGAHVIDVPGGRARPVEAKDWPDFITGVNEAALVKAQAVDTAKSLADKILVDLKAAHKAELDSLKAELASVKTERDQFKALTKPERKAQAQEMKKNLKAQLDKLDAEIVALS